MGTESNSITTSNRLLPSGKGECVGDGVTGTVGGGVGEGVGGEVLPVNVGPGSNVGQSNQSGGLLDRSQTLVRIQSYCAETLE